MVSTKHLATLGALACITAACTPAPAPGGGGRAAAPPSPPAAPVAEGGGSAAAGAARGDTGRIARLEREARALAHAEGCAAGRCRTAPLGSRPCGGPREYIVYCAATTDSAALFARLAELARAEDEHNRRAGMASTCEYRMPPHVTVAAGRCTAAPPDEPGPQ